MSTPDRAEVPHVAEAAPTRKEGSCSKAFRLFVRRRRFIIDPRFQGGMLLAFAVQLSAFIGVLTLGLFLPPMLAIHYGEPEELLGAARQMIALDARYWPALLGATFLVVLLVIRTSHKIAGPLYRFRRVFESILQRDDPGPVRLRAGDYLKPEAEFLDRVVRSVVADRKRLSDFETQLRLLLAELDQKGGVEAESLRNLLRRRFCGLLPDEEG